MNACTVIEVKRILQVIMHMEIILFVFRVRVRIFLIMALHFLLLVQSLLSHFSLCLLCTSCFFFLWHFFSSLSACVCQRFQNEHVLISTHTRAVTSNENQNVTTTMNVVLMTTGNLVPTTKTNIGLWRANMGINFFILWIIMLVRDTCFRYVLLYIQDHFIVYNTTT